MSGLGRKAGGVIVAMTKRVVICVPFMHGSAPMMGGCGQSLPPVASRDNGCVE
jgi:hypothetical protein